VPAKRTRQLTWPSASANRHCGLVIFGLCCRYHSRPWDGRLQGQYDDCERPCVADSCALITVPSQLRQLGDVRRDAPRLVARLELHRWSPPFLFTADAITLGSLAIFAAVAPHFVERLGCAFPVCQRKKPRQWVSGLSCAIETARLAKAHQA
jgi:hypothetical protein